MVAVAMQQGRISKIYSSVVQMTVFRPYLTLSAYYVKGGGRESEDCKLPEHAPPKGVQLG